MIYPARTSILLAAAIAPVALLLGILMPAQWYLGVGALGLLLLLMILDGLLALSGGRPEVICDAPGVVSVGAPLEIGVHLRFERTPPERVEVALGTSALVQPVNGSRRIGSVAGGAAEVLLDFLTLRRGTVSAGPLWLRWHGPMHLVWRQLVVQLDRSIVIAPDIRPVREHTAQMLQRDYSFGQTAQLHIGEGAEFEALAEFRAGMDRRAIDWKQSARHTSLLAKEFRTERNNTIVMAVDAGRAMCEPLMGVPRVDRAVSAALLTSFVALRDGDRVGFFGFDSHPRVASKAVSGQRAFSLLQRVAAQIDYSANETNYTLALATLAETLQRRSLIIMFTDFSDTVSAELMLHAVGTLLNRHLVLFVVMRDEELEALVEAEPSEPADVTRAVTAAALLRQRSLVIAKLRRLGVHVLESRFDAAGPALVNAYLDFKRRSLL